MIRLLSKLWKDDQGAVISTELILVIGVLVFGLIPAFVALRNSLIASMATMGNTLNAITPSFTFSGFAIGSNNSNGRPIAAVNGYSLSGTTGVLLSGVQVPPYVLTAVILPPAP